MRLSGAHMAVRWPLAVATIVLVSAVAYCWSSWGKWRAEHEERIAFHAENEKHWLSMVNSFSAAEESDQSLPFDVSASVRHARLMVEYHRKLKTRHEHSARRPWMTVAAEELPPEDENWLVYTEPIPPDATGPYTERTHATLILQAPGRNELPPNFEKVPKRGGP